MRKFRWSEGHAQQSDDGGKHWISILDCSNERFQELFESSDFRESSGARKLTIREERASRSQKKPSVTDTNPRLVEAYRGLGLTEVDAKAAAGIEEAVVTKSLSKLAESFKSLGMTDEQAIEAASKVGR
jgi:hypothetical protein